MYSEIIINGNILDDGELESASEMLESLEAGTFYSEQEAAHDWLKAKSDGSVTRWIIERQSPFGY